ncbi:OmpA family protein [Flavobacterium sp. xlx-214]|uniref:OmpA family protein n=1 Tax=unclassified Flavobacterium TaxID=196869 RepID=UPI0013D6E29C|nr:MULTISPECIES: OmpA family protein [unclassified Flavobacterium]MBA5793266.1 OmpA family protein [Flavobacterium sp. xlx-221]QMI82451.1 OmpA family protein [Flavobacterium sp. xlx-214]
MRKLNVYVLTTAMLAGTFLTSCNTVKNANNTQKGAAAGAAAGAVIGGVLGNNVGSKNNSALGAVLGGVIGGTAGAIIGKGMDKQAQEIETALPGAEVERVGEGIKVVLNESTVNFNFDSAELTPTAQANLDKIVKVFKQNPKTMITIYGYTDSVGKDEYNMKLSRSRANAVRAYMGTKGIGSKRITAQGMGEADPIASNDTKDGQAKNRRVEFGIVANEDMIQDARKEAAKY